MGKIQSVFLGREDLLLAAPVENAIALQGIELKTTEANLLLGQEHLHSGGKFVAAQPGRKQAVRANGTASVGA